MMRSIADFKELFDFVLDVFSKLWSLGNLIFLVSLMTLVDDGLYFVFKSGIDSWTTISLVERLALLRRYFFYLLALFVLLVALFRIRDTLLHFQLALHHSMRYY